MHAEDFQEARRWTRKVRARRGCCRRGGRRLRRVAKGNEPDVRCMQKIHTLAYRQLKLRRRASSSQEAARLKTQRSSASRHRDRLGAGAGSKRIDSTQTNSHSHARVSTKNRLKSATRWMVCSLAHRQPKRLGRLSRSAGVELRWLNVTARIKVHNACPMFFCCFKKVGA